MKSQHYSILVCLKNRHY